MPFRYESPSDLPIDAPLRRDDGAVVVGGVSHSKLHELVTRYVPFLQDVKGVLMPFAPPMSLSKLLLDTPDHWRFAKLTGLIQAPTLRADGSLLQVEGYDQDSGLLLDLNGVDYPPIPDAPTREDAVAAMALLKEPFAEVPFALERGGDFEPATSPSLSVALAAILTGLIRRTLPTAPLFGFDAPEAGSGKGLCCNSIALIVTGTRATMLNYATNETEFRKMLFSALLANDLVITLDNIAPDHPLEGETLNSMLTEQTIGDRILGVSRVATVPTNCLVMATGNNLSIKGDMQRRIIAARIEAGENPEKRAFKRSDLLAWVRDNRPRLVVAGLTVLRAYDAAGRPSVDMPSYGSYEEWSRRVRAPLMWLGEADPVKTNERFKIADPERDGLIRVIHNGRAEYGRKGAKAKDLAALVGGDLWEAFNDLGLHDAMSIGKYLQRNEGRTIDGIQLVATYDTRAKVNIFYFMDVNDRR